MSARAIGLFFAGALTAGCFTTTIKNGRPPGQTPFGYDDKWHSGFIFGIAEASGPYNLQEVCPGGWSEIRTETGFWNGLVSGITRDIYTAQSVGVTCAEGGAAPAPATPAAADTAPAEPGAAEAPVTDTAPEPEASPP